jgi:Ran GTPase-activating protein (RanGAP) involved in mRNA processing and transport
MGQIKQELEASEGDSDSDVGGIEEQLLLVEQACRVHESLDSNRGDRTIVQGVQADHLAQIKYLHACRRQQILPNTQVCKNLCSDVINIEHYLLGSTAILAMSQGIREATSLTELYLTNNAILDLGCAALASALNGSTSIQVLVLGKNGIGTVGHKFLGQLIGTVPNLRELNLDENRVGTAGSLAIAEGMHVQGRKARGQLLRNLHLQRHEIDHATIENLVLYWTQSSTVVGCKLKHLDLSWNRLKCRGVVTLVGALARNHSLEYLNIGEPRLKESS